MTADKTRTHYEALVKQAAGEKVDVLATGELSTHRIIQLSELHDRAQAERVRYFCHAITAKQIGNRGAIRYFSAKARKWEQIRERACRLLCRDSLARTGASA